MQIDGARRSFFNLEVKAFAVWAARIFSGRAPNVFPLHALRLIFKQTGE